MSELMAYDRLEAGGDYRLCYQIAVLCCVVAAAHTDKKGKKPKPEDFLVCEFQKPEEPTAQDLWTKFKRLVRR